MKKKARRDSSFFWEERNVWFSDVWEIKGVKQTIDNAPSRDRNASYPLELPYRLINMYSQKGDVVLDPFMGLGTTSIAAILTERNSVGFEIDPLLKPLLKDILGTVSVVKANALINERYKKHLAFVDERIKMKKEVKYDNVHMDCKVMTGQETDMNFHYLKEVNVIDEKNELVIESSYYLDNSIKDLPIAEKGTLFE